MKPVIDPVAADLIENELTPERLLRRTNNGGNEIYVMRAQECPNLMREIGLLRERSFRDGGGGTGADVDIDELSADYTAVDAHVIDGEVYYVDYGLMSGVIYYNTDMWEAAGLTEADIPQTWDELREAALTPLVSFLPLDAGAAAWAEAILSLPRPPRAQASQEAAAALKQGGYALQDAAAALLDFYRTLAPSREDRSTKG